MHGLMQDWPLRIPRILDHAAEWHGEREIVSCMLDGSIHRYGYRDLHRRAGKLANALVRMGLREGDRVGTLCWNTFRHMELYYATAGTGTVCHTVNPRLFADQIAYIIAHAEDRVVFAELTFVPLLEQLTGRLPAVECWVLMTDRPGMPETSLPNALCYEELVEAESDAFEWRPVDERAAATLCYTSGTTGNPKGVLYSHRSMVLHTLMLAGTDAQGLCAADTVLSVVPLFHANAWGLPYLAPMVGAKLVLPGMRLDGESIFNLLEAERVTYTAAVPTIWMMLLQHLEKTGQAPSTLRRVLVGGSAMPRRMFEIFEERYGVDVRHGWGMTEMSPLGTVSSARGGMEGLDLQQRLDVKVKQGRPMFTVEMRIVDDAGRVLPHDGKAVGLVQVRGPGVARGYFKGEGGEILDHDGWFDTGDVGTIDPQGYLHLTDRSKDIIKSGGEWISSIELENLAVGHPEVAEAAVIGLPHPKWDERPLLIVVPKPGTRPTPEDLIDHMRPHVAKWWLPDEVVFVEEIPHTATGKIQKTALRRMFEGHVLPTA